jgi:hypothetical protein
VTALFVILLVIAPGQLHARESPPAVRSNGYRQAKPPVVTPFPPFRCEENEIQVNLIKPSTKGNPMKPIMRYQSQLLYRRSYRPKRVIRIRPRVKVNIVFRPSNRFGVKPQLTIVS